MANPEQLRNLKEEGVEAWNAWREEAGLNEADLTGCRVYVVSAWGFLLGASTKQQNLIITPYGEPAIATDLEIHGIVWDFQWLAIQPILLRGEPEFVSMSNLRKFPWLLPPFEYENVEHRLANLDDGVVAPAEAKARELQRPQQADAVPIPPRCLKEPPKPMMASV